MTSNNTFSSINNQQFLEIVFADALPGAHTVITAFHGDPNCTDREQSARNWCGRPWFPSDPVPAWFNRANSYLTVSMFEPDPETGELRRRKANFVQMCCVMIDDLGTKVPHERIALPPSAVIETSPGNHQAFYLLRTTAQSRDRATCELLVQRMVAAGLAIDSKDPGMTGVTRYARLPVGINSKRKYARPFAVRLRELNGLRYTLHEVARAYGLDLTAAPERGRYRELEIAPETIKRCADRFEALLTVFRGLNMYHGSSGPWHQVTCPWVEDHTEHADTGAAISEPSPDNNYAGGFVCHHGHCRHKHGMADVRRWCRDLARTLEARLRA